MSFRVRLLTMAAALALAGTLLLPGQTAQPRGPMRMYNPASETTIKGVVDEVKPGTRGRMMGTHLIVKSGETTTDVSMGPSQFIASQGFTFAKGDAVEITGSKVTQAGIEYFIAREAVKEGKTLTLRDKNGRPMWAGGVRRQKPLN